MSCVVTASFICVILEEDTEVVWCSLLCEVDSRLYEAFKFSAWVSVHGLDDGFNNLG